MYIYIYPQVSSVHSIARVATRQPDTCSRLLFTIDENAEHCLALVRVCSCVAVSSSWYRSPCRYWQLPLSLLIERRETHEIACSIKPSIRNTNQNDILKQLEEKERNIDLEIQYEIHYLIIKALLKIPLRLS